MPYYEHFCEHHELPYDCEHCRKDPAVCVHEDCVSRWHYEGDKLISAGGVCYECGKDLVLNAERNRLV